MLCVVFLGNQQPLIIRSQSLRLVVSSVWSYNAVSMMVWWGNADYVLVFYFINLNSGVVGFGLKIFSYYVSVEW